MRDWLAEVDVQWGALALVAAGLLLALVVLLPRDKRRLLRRPLLLFAAYLGILVLGATTGQAPWLRVVAFTCVLLVAFRAALLLATETRPGRWLVPPLPRIFVDILQFGLYGVVAILTLHTAGLEPGELLTTSALLTAVVGLALQDTLGNVFSGLAMQIGQPFEVGDWIELDNGTQHGRVIEIGWRATKLVTLDDTEIIVPNGVIAKSVVRNFTRPTPVERRRIHVGIDYTTPSERAREVLLGALRGAEGVLEDPPPSVILVDFAANALEFEVRYFLEDHRAAETTDSRVRERLWYALDRAGINIPFPQRHVHLFQHDARRTHELAVEAREQALRHVDLFDVLPEDAHRKLAATSATRRYATGEVIVRQGEPGAQLFVVLEGEVAVLVGDDEVARLGPEAFFGEMSLLTGAVRAATVRARSACRVLVVDREALQPVLAAHPGLVEALGQALAQRSRALEAHAARADTPQQQERVEEDRRKFLERIRAFFPS